MVADNSFVSSSSNSTTNFHLVTNALCAMSAYSMASRNKTQDIVRKIPKKN
jgi:hypothetical protein